MTNDLISREAALEIIMKYCLDDDGSCSKADADLREMLDEIENIPAVDAVPVVHGRWGDYVCVGYNGTKPVWARPCSECGYESKAFATKYCPNCGAKMDLEEHDD